MGPDHGRPPEENACSLPYLSHGHSIWAPTQAQQGITITDRRNLLMLESRMRLTSHVRFGGLRHEVAYIAVEPGNRTQPNDLPSVLYRDMQRG